MREYVDGIYIKLKPEERELIKNKMKEAVFTLKILRIYRLVRSN